MPRNNGIYTPPPSNWSPAVDGLPANPTDWNNLLADIAAALSQSLSKDGQTKLTGNLDFNGNRAVSLAAPNAPDQALRYAAISKGPDIASSGTVTIPNEGVLFDVTGTTGISTVSMPYPGKFAFLRFEGVLTITNSASLLLPGGRNYTTKVGDMLLFIAIGGGNVQVFAGGGGGFDIGDYLDTVRTPDNTWLRRNGSIYSSALYPELSLYFPPLPAGLTWENFSPNGIAVFSNPRKMSNGEFSVVGGGQFQKSSDWLTMSEPATYVPASNQIFVFSDHIAGAYVVCSIGFQSSTTYSSVSVSVDGGETFQVSGFPFATNTEYLVTFNGLAIIVASKDKKVYTSPDGATWTERSVSEFLGLVYAPKWSSCESGGALYLVCEANNEGSFVTNDGINYTRGQDVNANGIAVSGSWFIAVGDGGQIWRTQDFINEPWVPVASGTTKNLNGIVENNGVLIAVGDGVTLMSSNDGAGWVTTATDETRNILTVIQHADDSGLYVGSVAGQLLLGEISNSPMFRVPDDNPTTGWIKAL